MECMLVLRENYFTHHWHVATSVQVLKLTGVPQRKLESTGGGASLLIGRFGGLGDRTNRCVVVQSIKLGKKSF